MREPEPAISFFLSGLVLGTLGVLIRGRDGMGCKAVGKNICIGVELTTPPKGPIPPLLW